MPQFSILPHEQEVRAIEQACGLDIASHFQPSSEIGGDFWGIKSLFPHQTALWTVDFSGHGVASALNTFRLQAYLKDKSDIDARPGEYLSYLNDKLLHLLSSGTFATMFYAIVDSQSDRLFYAAACNPPPIIFYKDSGEAEFLDGSGRPLGIGMNFYQTRQASFASGDKLLLYSDALTESIYANGNYIGEQKILEIFKDCKEMSASATIDRLVEYLKSVHAVISDDLTICVCRKK